LLNQEAQRFCILEKVGEVDAHVAIGSPVRPPRCRLRVARLVLTGAPTAKPMEMGRGGCRKGAPRPSPPPRRSDCRRWQLIVVPSAQAFDAAVLAVGEVGSIQASPAKAVWVGRVVAKKAQPRLARAQRAGSDARVMNTRHLSQVARASWRWTASFGPSRTPVTGGPRFPSRPKGQIKRESE